MSETEILTEEFVGTNIELLPEAQIAPENQAVPAPIVVERNPADWVTPNFTWREFLYSQTAERLHLNNTPTAHEKKNIVRVAEYLELLRAALAEKHGRVIPIRITSGFRSKAVNKAVGGVSNSAHLFGLAADIQAVGISIKQLAYDIQQFTKAGKLPKIDQVIREMPRNRGQWVHVGLSATAPRGEWWVYEWNARAGKNKYDVITEFRNPSVA